MRGFEAGDDTVLGLGGGDYSGGSFKAGDKTIRVQF